MSVGCAEPALSVALSLEPALLPESLDEPPLPPLPPLLESVEVALALEPVELTVVEPDVEPDPVADAALLRAEVAAAELYEVVEKEQERRISYASL